MDEPLTSEQDITHYNNFYEFSTSKGGVAAASAGFSTNGWQLRVDGLVHKPRVFTLDDVRGVSPPEERVYRMRCVEAWSMVIPWAGFPLSKLLDLVEPTSDAKYVAFETLLDPKRMPGKTPTCSSGPTWRASALTKPCTRSRFWQPVCMAVNCRHRTGRLSVWWFLEVWVQRHQVDRQDLAGIDAARHQLEPLRPEGVRLFRERQSPSRSPPMEPGNRATIGESGRRKTLMFNGYGDQVASLYAGMNLKLNY